MTFSHLHKCSQNGMMIVLTENIMNELEWQQSVQKFRSALLPLIIALVYEAVDYISIQSQVVAEELEGALAGQAG
jgi:chaperone required for assembly of F1-ATPase